MDSLDSMTEQSTARPQCPKCLIEISGVRVSGNWKNWKGRRLSRKAAVENKAHHYTTTTEVAVAAGEDKHQLYLLQIKVAAATRGCFPTARATILTMEIQDVAAEVMLNHRWMSWSRCHRGSACQVDSRRARTV